MTDIAGIDIWYIFVILLAIVLFVLLTGWRPSKRGVKRDYEHHNAWLDIEGKGRVELLKSHIQYTGNATDKLIEKERRVDGSG